MNSVADGDTTLGSCIGFDRAAHVEAPVDLSLLQSPVPDAFTFWARRLSLGLAALEPKAKMGCKPAPLACAMRHCISALNRVVSALTRTASHDEPPERNPFKASAGNRA